MDYTLCSLRELRKILASTTDAKIKKTIEEEIVKRVANFNQAAPTNQATKAVVIGVVRDSQPTQTGGLKVVVWLPYRYDAALGEGGKVVITRHNEPMTTSVELTPDQVPHYKCSVGEPCELSMEFYASGITQYKDKNGDTHFYGEGTDLARGTIGIKKNIPNPISTKEIEMRKLISGL